MGLDDRSEVDAVIERARSASQTAREVLKPLRAIERQSGELRKEGSAECARALQGCSDARSSLSDAISSQQAGKRRAAESVVAESTRVRRTTEIGSLLSACDSLARRESWRARLDELLRQSPLPPPLPAPSGTLSSLGELHRRFVQEDVAIQEGIQRLDPYPQSRFPARWRALHAPRPSVGEWRATVLRAREQAGEQERPCSPTEPARTSRKDPQKEEE